MGRALRAKPEAGRQKVGLEHRLEHDPRGGHRHPVADCGYPERPGLARLARLGDMYPTQRLRPVSPGPKLGGESFEEFLHPGLLDSVHADAIDPGSALVGTHVAPRLPHHVAAGDLVKQGVKPTHGILLGTAIKHALEGSNAVPANGRTDGASRKPGTHQRSSRPSTCTDEVGALRSGRVVLSRPSSLSGRGRWRLRAAASARPSEPLVQFSRKRLSPDQPFLAVVVLHARNQLQEIHQAQLPVEPPVWQITPSGVPPVLVLVVPDAQHDPAVEAVI